MTSRNPSEQLIFLLVNSYVVKCEHTSEHSITTTQLCQLLTSSKANVIYKDRVDATN